MRKTPQAAASEASANYANVEMEPLFGDYDDEEEFKMPKTQIAANRHMGKSVEMTPLFGDDSYDDEIVVKKEHSK